jgi:hypothetical protein
VWKLPDLWTQRTRPQGPWKTHKTRFPQLPHALTMCYPCLRTNLLPMCPAVPSLVSGLRSLASALGPGPAGAPAALFDARAVPIHCPAVPCRRLRPPYVTAARTIIATARTVSRAARRVFYRCASISADGRAASLCSACAFGTCAYRLVTVRTGSAADAAFRRSPPPSRRRRHGRSSQRFCRVPRIASVSPKNRLNWIS